MAELEIHPFVPLGTNRDDHPEVLRITHNENNKPKENAWHSDVTWRLEPSLGSILRMIETPLLEEIHYLLIWKQPMIIFLKKLKKK